MQAYGIMLLDTQRDKGEVVDPGHTKERREAAQCLSITLQNVVDVSKALTSVQRAQRGRGHLPAAGWK